MSTDPNRAISDKPPVKYFPTLMEKVGKVPFTAQCIPTEDGLLNVEAYKSFLARRREMIADRLNAFLSSE